MIDRSTPIGFEYQKDEPFSIKIKLLLSLVGVLFVIPFLKGLNKIDEGAHGSQDECQKHKSYLSLSPTETNIYRKITIDRSTSIGVEYQNMKHFL